MQLYKQKASGLRPPTRVRQVWSMWSNRFLLTGVLSGVFIALLTVALIWLGLFVVSGSKDPGWTIANISRPMLLGVIVYAACWYVFIFRARDYSFRQTIVLVACTFGIGCAVVAVMLIAGATITVLPIVLQATKGAVFGAVIPVVYGLMSLVGATILFVPYAIFATPMALLHRWLLLRNFA
jgi:hypothetical protein